MLLILSILLHHNVTMTCLSDIISLVNLHCLQGGLKKNSLFKFRNFFGLRNTTDLKRKYFCSTCMRELLSKTDICPSYPMKKNCFFTPLQCNDQLRDMYLRRDFYNHLQYRFNRPFHGAQTITDVYDGDLYRTWFDNGFLSNPHNI